MMKKTYVLQMRALPEVPWVVVWEFDTPEEAWKEYNSKPVKYGYRVAEAYTVVRYKPLKEAAQ